MKHLLMIAAAIVSVTFAQSPDRRQSDPSRPVIGWDSLKSMIVYPELARRAGVQGYSNVTVEVDETGNVASVSVSGHGIFRSNIEEVVRSVKWIPEMNEGKAVKSSVVFEIQFQLKNIQDMPKKRVLIIESEIPAKNKK